MSQTLCVFLTLFCMFGWVSAGQGAFSDDLSLLQEHAHALPQQQKWPDIGKHALPQEQKWPDIGKIVDSVKEAVDSAKGAANDLNDAIHDKIDQAASATSTAIQSIVKTLNVGLGAIFLKADDFENNVQKAIDAFLHDVQTNPDLLTFASDANQLLDTFGASLKPIASALNVSIKTVQDVLTASGFEKLSEDVGAVLTQAMGAISEADVTTTQLKQKVGELAAKVNESAGNFSSEIDKALTDMNTQLHHLVEEVNKTFVVKTVEGYKTLASGLRESVESVLPDKQLQEVVDSLDTINPVVQNITNHVSDPIQKLEAGFDEAVADIREQEHAHALPQQQKWPDIGKIVDSVKEAADSAKDAANDLKDKINDKLDEAASATSTAIQTVVQTLKVGLETVLSKADIFENDVQKAIDAFLQDMQTNPDLLTFEKGANQTLDAFGASLGPIAFALNVSIGTVQDVLTSSGFDKLSADVGAALIQAMGAINKANVTNTQLKQTVGELAAKVNESAGKISSEIDEKLKDINTQLHQLVEEVNRTFVVQTIEGYKTLASGLRESIEGVLPEKQLQEVVDSLDTINPVVQNITNHMADPVQKLEAGFDEAVADIREHVPA